MNAKTQVLNFLKAPGFRVVIHKTDERGSVEWAVARAADPEYWERGGFKTLKDARDWALAQGFEIQEVGSGES